MNRSNHLCRFAFVVLFAITSRAMVSGDDATDELPLYPSVRFITPVEAELTWESDLPGTATVEYRLASQASSESSRPQVTGTSLYRARLTGLRPGGLYRYQITIDVDGQRRTSQAFEFDNTMNYTAPRLQSAPDAAPSAIDAILERLHHLGGYAVVAESLADSWAACLASQTSMTVVAACEQEEQLSRRRRTWYETGDYGIRLSAQLRADIPDGIANLVIIEPEGIERGLETLAPQGWLVCVGQPPAESELNWTRLSDTVHIASSNDRTPMTRWDHQYGSASNQSYSGETLSGVDKTDQLEIRWLGRPGADFGIDRNPRMPAPLAVGGRLFHQGMNRMIALDAFNGAVLWSLEIPPLRRVNIPRDCANWCADERFVYTAIGNRLWVIDGATGELARTMRLPDSEDDTGTKPSGRSFDWGYVAATEDTVVGTAVLRGSQYKEFWSKPAWYDGKDDQATAKVCGQSIIAYDKQYGDVRWKRNVDAVIHSTLTVADDRLLFVEIQDPKLREQPNGKLTNEQIADRAVVVCVDLKTGQELWTSPAPAFAKKQIVAFGLADDGQFLLETSSDAQFHFTSFDLTSGERRWSTSAKWPEDHHGAHMQHAVLMNGKIYVQPQILDANSGEILKTNTLGKRRGCATPVGTGNTIIYRGGGGPLSLWSLESNDRSEFSRLRPSCWLSTIPAQGMLFSPEAGGGCSCGGWMECSIGFAPSKESSNDAK